MTSSCRISHVVARSMDLRRDSLEVGGTVAKLLGHTGVMTRARAKVGFVDGQGQMWEALWEVTWLVL